MDADPAPGPDDPATVDDVPAWWKTTRPVAFIVLSLTLIGFGVARASGRASVDEVVLYFLATAGVVLVLERVTEITVGKDGVSAKATARGALQYARANRDIITGKVGGKTVGGPLDFAAARSGGAAVGPYPGDPQKGLFGGSPERDGWALSADAVRVQPGELCKFTLRVSGPPGDGREALFHLHDTFRPQVRTVPLTNGRGEHTLIAYGAFTVGVEIPHEGREPTRLELDLADDPQFPEWFRER